MTIVKINGDTVTVGRRSMSLAEWRALQKGFRELFELVWQSDLMKATLIQGPTVRDTAMQTAWLVMVENLGQDDKQ